MHGLGLQFQQVLKQIYAIVGESVHHDLQGFQDFSFRRSRFQVAKSALFLYGLGLKV